MSIRKSQKLLTEARGVNGRETEKREAAERVTRVEAASR
jgi:hypothetical protein